MITATHAAETTTGLERIADGDLAHHYPGRWPDPGNDVYPASTLIDEIGSLNGTITSAWTAGVAPTSMRALTMYHAKHALQGASDVGTMGKCPGVFTGVPGRKLAFSGVTWVDFKIAHVTRRNNPSTTADEIILQITESAGIGYYVTPAGVVTFGQYLIDPFLESADRQVPYSNVVPPKPASSWNSEESPDPPRVLQMEFGAVSFTEDPAALLIGGDPDDPDASLVLDRNAWRALFRTVKIPIPNAAKVFPLSSIKPVVQSGWWATEAGARAEGQRRAQIMKFRRLKVDDVEVLGEKWLYAHPVTAATLLPFDVVEITHPHAEHLESGGTVRGLLWEPVRNYGSITVRLDLRSIRIG